MQTSTQSHTQAQIQAQTQVQPTIAQGRRVIAAATLLFGLGLVFLTGFAHSQTVHNAAHDTRHAMAFPCH
jgi:cobalt transporter subunit CbtB